MTAKDAVLATLAERANVAQFVSFGPDPALPVRYCRLHGLAFDHRFATAEEALAALFERASYETVNVRSFRAVDTTTGKGQAFHYGLKTVDDVLSLCQGLAAEGLHTIANETIPVDDGGVSGVCLAGVVEFAPDDTPRSVEKPGTTSLAYEQAFVLLRTVYGFPPEIADEPGQRVEFSIHPRKVGLRQTHTLVWELEHVASVSVQPKLVWPNRFSQMLGDKVFGLLVADLLGELVPRTTVINRRVAPFTVGRPTGTGEHWLRTAPREPVPGRYPTTFGWQDPFELLHGSDPAAEIASVIAQESVDAQFSGALLAGEDDEMVVEGVAGRGDEFMLGRRPSEHLPAGAKAATVALSRRLTGDLGPVRIEWVFDGDQIWVVQLQQATTRSTPTVIVAGYPTSWCTFDPTSGLDALRALIDLVQQTGEGIVIRGDVGVTSHFGDLLRRAGVPSRLERPRR